MLPGTVASSREKTTMSTPKPDAALGEDALQRLEALAAKTRAGIRLTAGEALELRELRFLKAAARRAKERAAIAKARHQLEDRNKYRLGGLALAAGLKDWPDALLQAGFAWLAGLNDDEKAALRQTPAPADSVAGANGAAAPPLGFGGVPPPARPQAALAGKAGG